MIDIYTHLRKRKWRCVVKVQTLRANCSAWSVVKVAFLSSFKVSDVVNSWCDPTLLYYCSDNNAVGVMKQEVNERGREVWREMPDGFWLAQS